MHPILFKIGSFELASYGLMTALGYGAASWYLARHLKRVKMDADTLWNILFIAFVGALVGAKLLYIIVSWPQLGVTTAEKIRYILHNFRYGFVFFGGLIVSVSAVIIYLRRKQLPLAKTADFIITAVPLGHALGRIGCFLAGCCHGKPTTMPWGVVFNDPHTLVAPELVGVPVHPTQLYESLGNFILFFLLHKLYQKPHKDGSVVLAYVACYSLMRFIIEFFRGDYRGGFILGLSPSQLISLSAAVLAAAGYIYLYHKGKHHAR